jgi:putative flavoprotein involved in K+ transport
MQSKGHIARFHTVVIGGGQAGLAVGYHLAKRGIPFVILDAQARVGDAWRRRWDSLRLFTPSGFSGLPGFPFPGESDFPTKNEMADYLETYAKRFRLPVRTGVRVHQLSKQGEYFIINAGDQQYAAENVVVAMANYQVPKVPEFARQLDPKIVQIHSHDYRNPSQLQEGGVLVVGVGNSGADIGIEVARTHPTWLSGKESGAIPFPIDGFLGRHILFRVIRFIGHHVLSMSTPIGRKARPKMLFHSAPLVRVKLKDLTATAIQRVPRVVGVRDGKPLLADGQKLDVRNVIWCTGFQPGFSWMDLPIFGERGVPEHDSGIVTQVPGLYFVGLHFLYAMSSATVVGVGRDAERIVKAIESRNLMANAG